MPDNLKTGKMGEDLAAAYLEERGYRIAARNFRYGRGEIDLIAWKDDELLVFVEVKTRRVLLFGEPESAVTKRKQTVLVRTAGAYMEQIGYEWAIRFDTIAVVLSDDGKVEIRHREDAFFLQ